MVYNTYTSKEPLYGWVKSLDDTPDYHFGFVIKDTGELIGSGSIGPHKGDPERWGLGYNLRKDRWGMGYATEAAGAMIRFARNEFGIRRFASNHGESRCKKLFDG